MFIQTAMAILTPLLILITNIYTLCDLSCHLLPVTYVFNWQTINTSLFSIIGYIKLDFPLSAIFIFVLL